MNTAEIPCEVNPMNEPIDTSVRPPSKLLRMFYRFPIYLYRIGLGRLMGKRFIHIQHTGRKSELPRHSVVEVAGYDPKEDAYYIAAAYGEKADWFRNMMKTPQVKAQVGGRHFDGGCGLFRLHVAARAFCSAHIRTGRERLRLF